MGRSPTNTAQCLRQDLNQQYTKLVDTINNSQTKFIISLIISLDGRQTINKDEKEENYKKLFTFIKEVGKTFSLKDKFRTNPEMSRFIQLLFCRQTSGTSINNQEQN